MNDENVMAMVNATAHEAKALVTEAELVEVEQIREKAILSPFDDAPLARLKELGVSMLWRLVRTHRTVVARLGSALLERDAATAALGTTAQERDHAYRRGRREAIEEAARYLRAFSKEATSNGLEDTAATLDAAAEGIENHEAELRKRHAHGQ